MKMFIGFSSDVHLDFHRIFGHRKLDEHPMKILWNFDENPMKTGVHRIFIELTSIFHRIFIKLPVAENPMKI